MPKQCDSQNPKAQDPNFICNPATGRWVSKTGPTGKKLLQLQPPTLGLVRQTNTPTNPPGPPPSKNITFSSGTGTSSAPARPKAKAKVKTKAKAKAKAKPLTTGGMLVVPGVASAC